MKMNEGQEAECIYDTFSVEMEEGENNRDENKKGKYYEEKLE